MSFAARFDVITALSSDASAVSNPADARTSTWVICSAGCSLVMVVTDARGVVVPGTGSKAGCPARPVRPGHRVSRGSRGTGWSR
jgi:hypothetical protein